MDTVKIKYIGHACFALSYEGRDIVIDPYKDNMVPGLKNMREKADFVYCSHGHEDHSWVDAVELSGEDTANFGLAEIEVPHDEAEGNKRGMNTVRIFSFGALRVAHMGDIGRVLTDSEAEVLKGVDCLMLPVGGFFTVNCEEAKTIAEQVGAKVVIPMHYSGCGYGFEQIATAKDFVALVDEASVRYGGSEFTLTADTESQIRLMRPAMLNVSVRDASKEFHSQGYNCCQSVLRALADECGLELSNANLGYGFGGGMHIKSVCGALTGGLMALCSACLDPEKPNPSRPDANALSLELEERFKARFETLMCSDIVEKYEKSLCGECIAYAAEETLKMIKEYKNK
ncbi:MAG: MBL fold metallo-hydrolase [Oscillospiraceae bacterium]|nr:MBL fold metallo-hydrolase [Oscillospiraceae bacterium]